MTVVSRIVSGLVLREPDGRPLCRYPLEAATFAELQEDLRSRAVTGQGMLSAAPGFVFWAAEHIRARFSGGKLTWAFVFEPLGLPPDDQDLGRELTQAGLSWWNRKVKTSTAGTRLFLYSLMAEGGIPEALLEEPGLYRNVVMGLLVDIEAEGGPTAASWAEGIAARYMPRLPQSFHGDDITRLLADLGLSLAGLRATLPADLPEEAAERWLNEHHSNWESTIPLRMTPKVAESLIRPALRAERAVRPAATGPFCQRELRRDERGGWHGYLVLHAEGWLPARFFPDSPDLRLRFLPIGPGPIDGLTYSAAPEDRGWRLHRLGRTARAAIPFPTYAPLALAAFADGQAKGEAVVEAGLPMPAEAPSFWRAAEPTEGVDADRLVPLAGAARTRGPCLWVLLQDGVEPEADAGLTLHGVEAAPNGSVRRVSGRGVLCVAGKRYRVETAAEDATDAPDVRLVAFGRTLPGWHLDGNIPVFFGDVSIRSQVGAGPYRPIAAPQLRRLPGRELGSEIVEWFKQRDSSVQIRLVRLPATTRFALREAGPGQIVLNVQGIDASWNVRLGASDTWATLEAGSSRLTLKTPGRPPGLVRLRLSDPKAGRALELQAPWPARSGMILDADGARLERNQPLSVDALRGWRAVTPDGVSGDLQLQLRKYRPVSLPSAGSAREMPLAGRAPLIEAMLAQEPDAQVNLSLVVHGQESHRLEIRRYHDQAAMVKDVLYTGLARDMPVPTDAPVVPPGGSGRLSLHAVDLSNADSKPLVESGATVDLRQRIGVAAGPWLIQARLDDRIQRAVFWSPRASPGTTRDHRIDAYANHWNALVAVPDHPEWDRAWRLIRAVRQGGDAGTLDNVQALASAPAAAVLLALRVGSGELADVLALESEAPIVWPILPVSAFTDAVRAEHRRRRSKLAPYFDEAEAEAEADNAIAKRVGAILALRPELAGHFGKALLDCELLSRILNSATHQETLGRLLLPRSGGSSPRARSGSCETLRQTPAGRGLPRSSSPSRWASHISPGRPDDDRRPAHRRRDRGGSSGGARRRRQTGPDQPAIHRSSLLRCCPAGSPVPLPGPSGEPVMDSRLDQTLARLSARAASSVVARGRIALQALNAALLRRLSTLPGHTDALLADPVFEASSTWESTDRSLEDLSKDLLQPALVDALDGAGAARMPRDLRPWSHQLEAWTAAREGHSCLISSGTGSGKTECFMVPLLDALLRDPAPGLLTGVRAILVYPLNALIESQRERLAAWTAPLRSRFRFALYNGLTPETPRKEDPSRLANAEIGNRQAIRERPPAILVTNITMLEYLLLRAQDRPILERSQGLLRWIVLDEAHGYIGAQAAEMALLLRRVRAAFGVEPQQAQLMATSATIGGGPGTEARLKRFTADLAGVDEDDVRVIQGRTVDPELPKTGPDTPFEPAVLHGLDPRTLWTHLAPHPRIHQLKREVSNGGATLSYATDVLFAPSSDADRRSDTHTILDAAARARCPQTGRRLLPWRAHVFHRAQGGLWVCVDPLCPNMDPELAAEGSDWGFGAVWLRQRDRCQCDAPVFELVVCNECGTPHLEAGYEAGASARLVPHRAIETDDFAVDAEPEAADDMDGIATDAVEAGSHGAEDSDGVQGKSSVDSGAVARSRALLAAPRGDATDRFLKLDDATVFDNAPPANARWVSIVLIEEETARNCCAGARTARLAPQRYGPPFLMGAALPVSIETLARPVDEPGRPMNGRRALTFSDSRQGTARLAAKLQQDAERSLTRAFLYHAVQEDRGPNSEERAGLKAKLDKYREIDDRMFADEMDSIERQLTGMAEPMRWTELVNPPVATARVARIRHRRLARAQPRRPRDGRRPCQARGDVPLSRTVSPTQGSEQRRNSRTRASLISNAGDESERTSAASPRRSRGGYAGLDRARAGGRRLRVPGSVGDPVAPRLDDAVRQPAVGSAFFRLSAGSRAVRATLEQPRVAGAYPPRRAAVPAACSRL